MPGTSLGPHLDLHVVANSAAYYFKAQRILGRDPELAMNKLALLYQVHHDVCPRLAM